MKKFTESNKGSRTDIKTRLGMNLMKFFRIQHTAVVIKANFRDPPLLDQFSATKKESAIHSKTKPRRYKK